MLDAASGDGAHDVTCVMDALDECRPSDRRWLIDMLARFYIEISPSSSAKRRGRLKFLVTSRSYNDIQAEFQKTLDDLSIIRLRGEEKNDQIHQEIDLVIRKRVTQLAKDLKLHPQTKDQLETKLLEMKHRTYLWLYLAIEDISKSYRNSLRPEEALINALPSTVEDAYEKILSRIIGDQRSIVKKILQIVVGARRPLAVQEMAIALGLATSPHSRSLRDALIDPARLETNLCHWCGLFVFINHTRIYLIHQTAKEFLICDSGSPLLCGWKHCLDPRETEKDMARICVKCLSSKDCSSIAQCLVRNANQTIDGLLEKDDPVETFLVYSAEFWPCHVRDADIPTNDPFMVELSSLYAINNPSNRLWFAIFWNVTHPYERKPRMSSVRLAALLGDDKLLDLILKSKQCYDINESDDIGRTALSWASELGYDKVVQILLNRGADINAEEETFGSALIAAAWHGHEKVVQILLKRGANVNARGRDYGNAI